MRNLLINLYYRLRILLFGQLSLSVLYDVLSSLADLKKLTFHEKIKIEAFKKEILSFAIASDQHTGSKLRSDWTNSEELIEYIPEFTSFIQDEEYFPGGMFNSELILLYAMIRKTKPEIFIECGSKYGVSARCIAQALKLNGNNAKLYCLSLFENDEKEKFTERLSSYSNVKVLEGKAEESIKALANEIGVNGLSASVGFLIDGPKARMPGWDELLKTIFMSFTNIKFIAFDSMQEHFPYYFHNDSFSLKKALNMERLRVKRLYHKNRLNSAYELMIQSHESCIKFFHLNKKQLERRNSEWGHSNPYKLFTFDKKMNHVSPFYKFGMLVNKKVFLNEALRS